MAVSAASSVGSTEDTKPAYTRNTSKDSKEYKIDTQTFLKMLVTQLQYQDPLSPQDNSQFVSQMAQMSSLSEMKDMSSALQNSQAYDMIGKAIYAEVTDKTTHVTTPYAGIVEGIVVKDGIPYVVVGQNEIAISNVQKVAPASADAGSELKKTQAFDMIGKKVHAEVPNEKTKTPDKYDGIVDSVVIKDGIPYVVVGGVNILVDDVLQVSPAPTAQGTSGTTPTT